MLKVLLTTLFLTIAINAFAHPVIYKGGFIYQGTFMPQMNEMKLGYTFDPKFAVVAKSQSFEMNEDYRDYTIGLNFLAKRWLQHDSQGNLYLGLHAGQYEDNNDNGFAGHALLMADWEDREDYFLFRTKRFYYNDTESQEYMGRYGFAPFVAGMNELQTWMIVQAYYYEEQSRELIITPMMRFFYKNVLWEIGSSTKGDSFLTLMVHY
jgi:hypothetical protein